MSESTLSRNKDGTGKNTKTSRFLERIRHRNPFSTSKEKAKSSVVPSDSVSPMTPTPDMESSPSDVTASSLHTTVAASSNTNNPIISICSVPQIVLPNVSSSSCNNAIAPRDLWSEAFDKLSHEDQKDIRELQPTLNKQPLSKKDVDVLLGQTKKVQQNIKDNSTRFRFRGKDIIVRDVVSKIVFWLSKFKDVGDIAVNFDPVHASLPWAGIRFLLQAAIGEHEQMGGLLVAIEKLSCLIHRTAIYQRLYHPGNVSSDVLNSLCDAMVTLHTAMLHIMSLSYRLLVKNIVKRAAHALFNPDELSGVLDKCEKLEAQVEREAHNCERARSQEADAERRKLIAILQAPILRCDNRVSTLLEIATKQERLKILDWTSDVLYGANHWAVSDKRTKDTCEWLLHHARYREWQDTSASTILWLCGNPGAGKTFLASKVIDEVRVALASGENHEAFAFFYCNRNEANRREPLSVLRALVRQLSTIANNDESIQRSLKQFYSESRLKATQPTMNDCKNFLLEYVDIYPRTTIVLDALDECERHSRLELMEALDDIVTKSSSLIRIFISSRPDLDIKKKLKDRSNIHIDAEDNHHDISKFVNNEISKHPSWHDMSPPLQEQIVSTLQERSQGMFQWAFLQIKQLLDLDLENDILERLGKLPNDLKKAYDEIYNSMNPAEKRIADRAFQWVMCASHPLATKELLPAICQDENSDGLRPLGGLSEDLVLKYCHNLLVIDPIRKVWIPSHLSVIEYLEDHLWNQQQANCLVANVCLSVLQSATIYNREENWSPLPNEMMWVDDDDTKKQVARAQAIREHAAIELGDPLHQPSFARLSSYARHHWPIHMRKSVGSTNDSCLSSRLQNFLGMPTESSAAYRCWYNMVDKEKGFSYPSSSLLKRIALHVLYPVSIAAFAYCGFGLSEVAVGWSDFIWVQGNHSTENGLSFLELAALSGSIHTCKIVIENGAEVNAQTDSEYGSALVAAVYYGHKEVVSFLLQEAGAEANMQLKNGDYGSALAAASSRDGKEIVELLIKHGADVNMQLLHGDYGSALAAAAASYGNKEIVELLIKLGADVNMQLLHGDYGSALAAAAADYGNKEIVELLIKHGADVNMQLQSGDYGSALATAAAHSNKEILELLIKHGADVNRQLQSGVYGSALAAAAANSWYESSAIIEYLVEEAGADVNMPLQHGNYATALEAAEREKNYKTADLLIKYGAKRREPERTFPGQGESNEETESDEESESDDETESDWQIVSDEEHDSAEELQSTGQGQLIDQATVSLSRVVITE